MSLILPNGLPTKKRRETLTREEVKRVADFEAWCKSRGLIMDLLCKHCLDAGHGPASRCQGDNARDALSFHISCGHADRVYGEDAPRL